MSRKSGEAAQASHRACRDATQIPSRRGEPLPSERIHAASSPGVRRSATHAPYWQTPIH